MLTNKKHQTPSEQKPSEKKLSEKKLSEKKLRTSRKTRHQTKVEMISTPNKTALFSKTPALSHGAESCLLSILVLLGSLLFGQSLGLRLWLGFRLWCCLCRSRGGHAR